MNKNIHSRNESDQKTTGTYFKSIASLCLQDDKSIFIVEFSIIFKEIADEVSKINFNKFDEFLSSIGIQVKKPNYKELGKEMLQKMQFIKQKPQCNISSHSNTRSRIHYIKSVKNNIVFS